MIILDALDYDVNSTKKQEMAQWNVKYAHVYLAK